jgi:hypothetical protein
MRHLIRQTHRWTSVLFTLIVAGLFAATGLGGVAEWVYFLPLPPLAVMMLTGLWMFVTGLRPVADRS